MTEHNQNKEEKKEEKTEHTHSHEHEHKEEKKQEKAVKRDEAVAIGKNLHISKKHSMYIGSFIKGKKIDDAIKNLEDVIKMKMPVPFKGEIPHRKGNIMSGRYPVNAARAFVNLLKGLKGNIAVNGMDLDNSVITIVNASWDSRPVRRGGKKAKRVHVIVKAGEVLMAKKEEKKKHG